MTRRISAFSSCASALARTYPPLLAKNDPGVLIRAADCPCRRMVTIKHRHARGPEETVCDLPPLVPARRGSRRPPTRLWQNGMPSRAAAEDASQLASPEPGLCHRLADRSAHDADPIPAGTGRISGCCRGSRPLPGSPRWIRHHGTSGGHDPGSDPAVGGPVRSTGSGCRLAEVPAPGH